MKNPIIGLLSGRLPNVLPTGKRENGRPVYKTEENFLVSIDNFLLNIPPGIEFDYASIPRAFWVLFLPNDPDYQAASLVHDVLYQSELFPRKINDTIFRSIILTVNPKVSFKANLMYNAVRVGGGTTYLKHKDEKILNTRTKLGLPCQSKLCKPYYSKEETYGLFNKA